LDFLLSILE
jgi:hypothetical protein